VQVIVHPWARYLLDLPWLARLYKRVLGVQFVVVTVAMPDELIDNSAKVTPLAKAGRDLTSQNDPS